MNNNKPTIIELGPEDCAIVFREEGGDEVWVTAPDDPNELVSGAAARMARLLARANPTKEPQMLKVKTAQDGGAK